MFQPQTGEESWWTLTGLETETIPYYTVYGIGLETETDDSGCQTAPGQTSTEIGSWDFNSVANANTNTNTNLNTNTNTEVAKEKKASYFQ